MGDQSCVDGVAEDDLEPTEVLVQRRSRLGVPVVEIDGRANVLTGCRQVGGKPILGESISDDLVVER